MKTHDKIHCLQLKSTKVPHTFLFYIFLVMQILRQIIRVLDQKNKGGFKSKFRYIICISSQFISKFFLSQKIKRRSRRAPRFNPSDYEHATAITDLTTRLLNKPSLVY